MDSSATGKQMKKNTITSPKGFLAAGVRCGIKKSGKYDLGLGIARSEQEQIFEKFFRASSAKAAGVRGTGLGLAMVRYIVAAHGGQLHVESRPGAGSTFTIFLPFERD